ncbi:hypothetical protein [Helicobacter bilis]|uniref:hypothetical protein n=1 Tax=Helicobacter bilis TaxID=37372 RepID=UPI00051D6D9F|nr:hypothetical protein [Helicobacter bilis]TLE06404.1 hypothetical protein LS78_011105 [Helicobacter bilis]
MASVVFEKQLANINKGLQALRSMNKELNKFEKGSNSTKMLRGTIKSLKEAESSVKFMALQAHMVNFDKAHKSLNNFNIKLQQTKKYLDTIYSKMKMVSFVGMAGLASAGGIGAGIANFGKGYISNQHKAKATGIKNFGGRSLQAVQNMSESITGNKDDLYNIIAHIQDNKTSINTSTDLAQLGINQNDWVKMDWQTQLQTLLDKSRDSMFDDSFNDIFHEAIQNLSGGLSVNQLRALSSELPNVSKAFNNALQDVASSENINKMTELGKKWQKTQNQMEAFFVDSASGVNKGLSNAIEGIGGGFNDLRSDTSYKAMLKVADLWLGANINQNSIKEVINNIPALIQDTRGTYNTISSVINSVSGGVKGTKNSINDLLAMIGITDKTDEATKHSELQDKFKAIQDDITSREAFISAEQTRLKNAKKYNPNDTQAINEYQNNINNYQKELQSLQQMKIEFTHKHEYDDKTGKWKVKETEITESKDTGGFFSNVLSIMNTIRGD